MLTASVRIFLFNILHPWTRFCIIKFMCGGVASKIDNEVFWTGLDRLRNEWHMTKSDLTKFMCGGVASRMSQPSFNRAIECIVQISRTNNLNPSDILRKLFYKTPYTAVATVISQKLFSIHEEELINYLETFRGSYRSVRYKWVK